MIHRGFEWKCGFLHDSARNTPGSEKSIALKKKGAQYSLDIGLKSSKPLGGAFNLMMVS